ncbi:UDP-glucose 4-epimerase GalE [Alteribacillus sp. HJP-4]|uniref:UDP-glucose 4-epimerase GalE n=1 Tax=Alteribacillus sp. HJP-4 TaxID=2775394 RepID=UPI0035CD141E
MSVLALGGAGYIGSHAVYQLLDREREVVVVDNLQTGHREAVPANIPFYEGDVRDRQFLKEVFAKEPIDQVMMFAANSLVGVSMKEPLQYFDNNVYGTQVLLETMVDAGVSDIVFSSTAAVYGEPNQVPIKECDPAMPQNPYGETKLAMEKMMKWCREAHDLRYVSLRYFNVAGARPSGAIGEDHDPETHLVPIILETALGKRKSITIYGDDYDTKDGTCIRDYVHVEDLIDAHIRALDYLKDGGVSDVFNLGSSTGFTVKEIIGAARAVTGKEIPSKIGERRPGDPTKLIASPEKAKAVLGWNPKRTDIDTIIEDAWNWHHHHPDGYGGR